jgi:hypothetical protein
MWMYLVVVSLAAIGVLGGIFAGGIFTVVLLPIAAIILVSSFVFTGLGKGAEQKEGAAPPEPALPHDVERPSGHAPTSPERLADARRVHQ